MNHNCNQNRKRLLSVATFTCTDQPPIERTWSITNHKQSSIVESHALNYEDANREHKDLIEIKHKLNNIIPGLIPSLSNIHKIDNDNDEDSASSWTWVAVQDDEYTHKHVVKQVSLHHKTNICHSDRKSFAYDTFFSSSFSIILCNQMLYRRNFF